MHSNTIVVQLYIHLFCLPFEFNGVLSTTWQMLLVSEQRNQLVLFLPLIVPCFLINCMTLLGFLLAPDSGEKLTLRKWNFHQHFIDPGFAEITTLLSIVTFSLLISDIIPPSSTAVPIITIYFLCVMCMCAISVSASVLVISLHFRDAKNYTMPLWVNYLVQLTNETSISLTGWKIYISSSCSVIGYETPWIWFDLVSYWSSFESEETTCSIEWYIENRC